MLERTGTSLIGTDLSSSISKDGGCLSASTNIHWSLTNMVVYGQDGHSSRTTSHIDLKGVSAASTHDGAIHRSYFGAVHCGLTSERLRLSVYIRWISKRRTSVSYQIGGSTLRK